MNATLVRQRDLDWVLALAAAAVAALAWGLLWTGGAQRFGASQTSEIATLASSLTDVRRRASGTLVWEELGAGAALSEGDAIFVPPASGATVIFNDGTRLDLDENTLVALELPPAGVKGHAVRVAKGDVLGASGSEGLSLLGRDAVARLEKGSQARLAVDPGAAARVEVLQGSARLQDGKSVRASESARIEGGAWVVSPAWPVRLVTPGAMARVFFHGAPPALELTFDDAPDGARVQVSAGSFDAPLLDVPASAAATFTAPAEGRYDWRVVDAEGRPQSETRRLWVVLDEPPVPLSPRDGESVAGFLGRRVPLSWAEVPGVGAYEVEVARAADFADVLVRRRVEGTALRGDLGLDEGHYHWRVRSSSPERGDSPWSPPEAFRYLLKPLPDAPELLDPELEVDL